jgi:hypothetical protein
MTKDITMDTRTSCAHCGQTYEPSTLLRGQCPTCLFAQALPEGSSAIAGPRLRFVPPKINQLAPLFPQLEINELIGCGGMSAVYKATQVSLGRTVAIKILPLEVATVDGGTERFQREARTLAQFNHPNIVQVFDAGQAGPWCYILMEYVPGPSLRQILGESQLPPADVLRITSAICDGLQYAHDRNVVHRDIKPENVLLDSTGQVKIADFGLAKSTKAMADAARVSHTGQVVGTPHYLAPEQMETPAAVDHRADLYSLGVMLYEMLTGELPLGHFAPPSRHSGSDPALDDVVLKAMSRDRHHRQQDARELKDRLAAAADSAPAKMTRPPAPPLTVAPATRRQAVWEMTLSACSLLAAFVGFVGTGNALDGFRNTNDLAQPLFGLPLMTLIAAVACLLSFVFARINVASRSSWTEITWTQLPSLVPLITAYAVLVVVLLIGPALAIWLLGSVPRFEKLEQWNFLGRAFTAADHASTFTPYWLRVYGVCLVACAAWCTSLAIIVRHNPGLVGEVFHPSNQAASASFLQKAAIVVAAMCAPFGIVLLLAF